MSKFLCFRKLWPPQYEEIWGLSYMDQVRNCCKNKDIPISFNVFTEACPEACPVCSIFGVASCQPYKLALVHGPITFTPLQPAGVQYGSSNAHCLRWIRARYILSLLPCTRKNMLHDVLVSLVQGGHHVITEEPKANSVQQRLIVEEYLNQI